MSALSSAALLPSILVPLMRRKSSSTNPASACNVLFSDIPVVRLEADAAAASAESEAAVAELPASVAACEAP